MKLITEKRKDNLQKARDNVEKAQDKMKLAHDRKHAKPSAFEVGEKVLKKDFVRKKRAGGKLDTHFTGSYEIIKKPCRGIYSLRGADPSEVIKVSDLKP